MYVCVYIYIYIYIYIRTSKTHVNNNMNNSERDLEKQIDMNSHSKIYYQGKMKILYIDYNDITKHVVLQDVMGHAVNKLYNK